MMTGNRKAGMMVRWQWLAVLVLLVVLVVGPVQASYTMSFSPTAEGRVGYLTANKTWAQIISGSGTAVSLTSHLSPDVRTALTTGSGLFHENHHKVLSYDTSALPDNATITGVAERLYVNTKVSDLGTFSLVTKGGTLADNTTLANGDYQLISTGGELSDRIAYASIPASGNMTITLNANSTAYISKTSYTVIEHITDWEADGIYGGSWVANNHSYASFGTVTDVDTGMHPELTVTYTLPEPLEYYAYGDSLTRATGGGSLAADGSDVYIIQMNKTHSAGTLADHNLDGGSEGSQWGLQNSATHPGIPYPRNVFVLFGANDWDELTALEIAANLKGIHTNYTAQGSNVTILIQTLRQEDVAGTGEWTRYENQRDNRTIIENYLDTEGIPYVQMYDAIDTVPGNCYADEWNTTLEYDHIHPTKEGHRLMGEYLWEYINGNLECPVTPVAAFSGTPTTGAAPLTVVFTDSSTNTPTSWEWDFGDSNSTNSTVQNPIHTYLTAGTYTVTLTATNAAGSDDETKTEYITASDETVPVAAFTKSRIIVAIPQLLVVNDTSTNTPTGWQWSWGDGTANATSRNATHIYSRIGFFPVQLTASNDAGSGTAAPQWVVVI